MATLSDQVKTSADELFEQWCQEHNGAHDLPIQGRLYGALVVLWQLEADNWSFGDLERVSSTGDKEFFGDRSIRNHTKVRVVSILRQHGQIDLIPAVESIGERRGGESGRTSSGTKRAGLDFMHLVRNALNHTPPERNENDEGVLLVGYLYGRVFSLLLEHKRLGGIKAPFIASESIATYIAKLLDSHRTNSGAVLQHLVGAKLEVRFAQQSVIIQHNSASTADVQTGRLGDFEIKSAVFHVTKRPTDDHFQKAWVNAENGHKVYLLVPKRALIATLELARLFDDSFTKKVNIISIEDFVAPNLDELAVFDRDDALRQLRQLLTKYNELVARFENDPSLKIVIPDFGVA